MRIKLLFALAILFLCAGVAFASVAVLDDGTYEGEAMTIDFTGNTVSFDGSKATVASNNFGTDITTDASSYKYAYMPISYNSDSDVTRFTMGGIADDLTASGITGVLETGAAEGYVELNDAADYIMWYMVLPETYYNDGTAADLQLSFDMSEAAAHSGQDSYTLTVYEDGSETGAMISEDLSMNATARGWVNATAMGDDVSISGSNKVLIGKLNTQADTDDVIVYGARLKYRPGVDFD